MITSNLDLFLELMRKKSLKDFEGNFYHNEEYLLNNSPMLIELFDRHENNTIKAFLFKKFIESSNYIKLENRVSAVQKEVYEKTKFIYTFSETVRHILEKDKKFSGFVLPNINYNIYLEPATQKDIKNKGDHYFNFIITDIQNQTFDKPKNNRAEIYEKLINVLQDNSSLKKDKFHYFINIFKSRAGIKVNEPIVFKLLDCLYDNINMQNNITMSEFLAKESKSLSGYFENLILQNTIKEHIEPTVKKRL